MEGRRGEPYFTGPICMSGSAVHRNIAEGRIWCMGGGGGGGGRSSMVCEAQGMEKDGGGGGGQKLNSM